MAFGLLLFERVNWGEISEVNPEGDDTGFENPVSLGEIGLVVLKSDGS